MRPLLAVLRAVAGHDVNFVRDAGVIIEYAVAAVWAVLAVAVAASFVAAAAPGGVCCCCGCCGCSGCARRGGARRRSRGASVAGVAAAWAAVFAYLSAPWHVRRTVRGSDVAPLVAADGSGGANGVEVRVATFNVRASDIDDGPANGWHARAPRARAALDDLRAAIVGTQEGFTAQLEYLAAPAPGRPAWRWFGAAAAPGVDVHDSAILYDAHAATLEAGDTVWLSATPEVAGTKLPDSVLYRTMTWGLFTLAGSGTRLLVFNTHLDHVGEEARRAQACIVAAAAARVAAAVPGGASLPQVLMGDFNTLRHTTPWTTLTSPAGASACRLPTPAAPWVDALTLTPTETANDAASFHGYLGAAFGSPTFMMAFRFAVSVAWLAVSNAPLTWHPVDAHIDWLLLRNVAPTALVRLHVINAAAPDGLYPSDHYPLLLQWKL